MRGKKIFLKKATKKDLNIIKDWRNSRGVREYNTQYTLLNIKNQKTWFVNISKTNSKRKMFMIFSKKNEPIGICGLIDIDKKNRNAEVSIILGEQKYRGKGYGVESLHLLVKYGFKKLKLHNISAKIIEYNKISIKLFEKADFKIDAILRDCIWRYGRWWNILQYSLLENDFYNKKITTNTHIH